MSRISSGKERKGRGLGFDMGEEGRLRGIVVSGKYKLSDIVASFSFTFTPRQRKIARREE